MEKKQRERIFKTVEDAKKFLIPKIEEWEKSVQPNYLWVAEKVYRQVYPVFNIKGEMRAIDTAINQIKRQIARDKKLKLGANTSVAEENIILYQAKLKEMEEKYGFKYERPVKKTKE